MHLQTILNHVERYKSFVFGKASWRTEGSRTFLEVKIEARANGRPVCSGCGKRRPGYDRLPARSFQFVPLWLGVDEVGTGLMTNALNLGSPAGVSLALARKGRVVVWTTVGIALLLHHGFSGRKASRPAPAVEP